MGRYRDPLVSRRRWVGIRDGSVYPNKTIRRIAEDFEQQLSWKRCVPVQEDSVISFSPTDQIMAAISIRITSCAALEKFFFLHFKLGPTKVHEV